MGRIRFNVMGKGDSCIAVTERYIAIRRRNGEVDLIPVEVDVDSPIRLGKDIVTIGYGNGNVVTEADDGSVCETF